MDKSAVSIALGSFLLSLGAADEPSFATIADDGSPTILITKSAADLSVDQFAGYTQTFDGPAISRSLAPDLPALLERSANLQLHSFGGNPMLTQLSLLGFGENGFGRVKILLDGVELNAVDMSAPDLSRIPLAAIERLEIFHGPSPVLHGDGAIAGVIEIETDTHDYTPLTRLSGRIGSDGTAGLGAMTRGGSESDRLAYAASYDFLRSDGWRDSSFFQTHAFNGSVRKTLADDSSFAVKVNYSNGLFRLPGALSAESLARDRREAAYQHDSCRSWNSGVAFDGTLVCADNRSLRLDFGFDTRHRTSTWGDFDYANDYDLTTFHGRLAYLDENDLFQLRNSFTAGYETGYALDDITDRSGFGDPLTEFRRLRHALFLRDELHASDDLSLIAGFRAENVDDRWRTAFGRGNDRSNNTLFGGELGVAYRPIKTFKAYLKTSHFARSAFCDETTYTRSGEPLSPEHGLSLNTGFDWNFLSGFTCALDAFALLMEDEIFYNPYSSQSAGHWYGYNENAEGRTFRYGLDSRLGWRREGVAEAMLLCSLAQARFVSGPYDGNAVPLVPTVRLRAVVGVWLSHDLEITLGYRRSGSSFLAGDFTNTYDELEGYGLFDLGAHYEPSWAKGWTASLALDNLLDRDFCDFAGYAEGAGPYFYPGRGRSLLFTLSYEF